MGKKVLCGYCGAHIYNHIPGGYLYGRIIDAEEFEGVNGYPSPIFGESMKCPNCFCCWGGCMFGVPVTENDNEIILGKE